MSTTIEAAPTTNHVDHACSPQVSVVIVNWNTAHLLPDCLDSITNETATLTTEIICVDNGSTDGSCDLLASQFPAVMVVPLDHNVGYQAACNIGSQAATGGVLLHINTDARLTPGALQTMLDVLEAHAQVAVVGPRLEYGDGTFQRWTAGQLPSLAALAQSFLLNDRVPGKGVWTKDDTPTSGQVGWVSSACLVVRAGVFETIGGLDEQFFAYMDDIDLCSRVSALGWSTWYEPQATAIHFMGGSQARTIGISATAIRSMVHWFRARNRQGTALAASLIMTLGFLQRSLGHLTIRRDRVMATAHLKSALVALTAGVRPR